MSATKHFLDTNCDYNESSGTFQFNDGYPEHAPDYIMRNRLRRAGFIETIKRNGNEPFTYNCDDLTRHRFYQAIFSNSMVEIDEEWYNTYLDLQEPSHWLAVIVWYEKDSTKTEQKVDFITTVGDERIAFWNDTNGDFYCRKLVNCKVIL